MAAPKTVEQKMDYYWKEYGILISWDNRLYNDDRRVVRYTIKFPHYELIDGEWQFSWKSPLQKQYNGVRRNEITYYINQMFFSGKPKGFKELLQKVWKGEA